MASPSTPQLTVVFDGTSAAHATLRRRLGRDDRIAWVACQSTLPPEQGRRLCERTLVAITAEGDVDTGWRALGRAVSAATGSPWPWRVATLPVICPLMSMATALAGRSLRRVPGIAPWCREHPEDCRARG